MGPAAPVPVAAGWWRGLAGGSWQGGGAAAGIAGKKVLLAAGKRAADGISSAAVAAAVIARDLFLLHLVVSPVGAGGRLQAASCERRAARGKH